MLYNYVSFARAWFVISAARSVRWSLNARAQKPPLFPRFESGGLGSFGGRAACSVVSPPPPGFFKNKTCALNLHRAGGATHASAARAAGIVCCCPLRAYPPCFGWPHKIPIAQNRICQISANSRRFCPFESLGRLVVVNWHCCGQITRGGWRPCQPCPFSGRTAITAALA